LSTVFLRGTEIITVFCTRDKTFVRCVSHSRDFPQFTTFTSPQSNAHLAGYNFRISPQGLR
jgi:hypothetical protein